MEAKDRAELYLDLEKIDEAAAMFAFLTSSGILPTSHVSTNKYTLFAQVLLDLQLRT